MKRVYWPLGFGVFLLGVWFFASPLFGDEEAPPAPKAVSTPSEQPGVVVERPAEAERPTPVAAPAPVQQEVNTIHASAALQDEALDEQKPDVIAAIEEATLVRKPVIDAIRLLGVSNADKYERMREALRASGDSVEVWTRLAPDVFAGWTRQLGGKGAAFDEGSVRCYLAGCEAQVYFDDEAEYHAASAAFRSLSEDDAAHGGRVQTPPKRLEDGRWVAAWMMLRPDVGVE